MRSAMSRQVLARNPPKKRPAFLPGRKRLPRGLRGRHPDVIHKDCVAPRCSSGRVKIDSLT